MSSEPHSCQCVGNPSLPEPEPGSSGAAAAWPSPLPQAAADLLATRVPPPYLVPYLWQAPARRAPAPQALLRHQDAGERLRAAPAARALRDRLQPPGFPRPHGCVRGRAGQGRLLGTSGGSRAAPGSLWGVSTGIWAGMCGGNGPGELLGRGCAAGRGLGQREGMPQGGSGRGDSLKSFESRLKTQPGLILWCE